MMEIVVPAPDYKYALTIIKSEANAIYTPLEGMVNLRFKTPFFNMKNMEKILDKAHNKNKKIYAVLNKSVSDAEFNFFCETIERLIILRVDGIVVGDLGLLRWAGKHLKKHICKIIASSVLGPMNKTDFDFLRKLGALRVIIPRLIGGESLSKIVTSSRMETEIYVHGSLCPSWDGASCKLINIYDSKRNGICIPQPPCITKFYTKTCSPVITSHLWNPMVQCDIGLIPWFNQIGVTSLKIIPPDNSPEYIKKVISIWHEALNSYYRDSDNWEIKDKWIQSLQKLHHFPIRMDIYHLGRNF